LISQDELGKYKLEKKISYGYFYAPKMYKLIYPDPDEPKSKTEIKSKGIKSMTSEQFE
jgi:hypothetical protein